MREFYGRNPKTDKFRIANSSTEKSVNFKLGAYGIGKYLANPKIVKFLNWKPFNGDFNWYFWNTLQIKVKLQLKYLNSSKVPVVFVSGNCGEAIPFADGNFGKFKPECLIE